MTIRKLGIFIIGGAVVLVTLIITGISYYQATHFNRSVSINGTNVGGMTAETALKKLQALVLKNKVYIGSTLVLNEKDTKTGFSSSDLAEIRGLLKKQWTWWPSAAEKSYVLVPSKVDQYRSKILKNKVAAEIAMLDKKLKAPKDAQALLSNGQILVSKSVSGDQLDTVELLKDYSRQEFNSEIHLKAVRLKPLAENSQTVENEKKKLQELMQRKVNYKVQSTTYTLAASQFIKNAAVSKNMKYSVDPSDIASKITAINRSQSTLNKNFLFKTHSGSVISVHGQSYGWALDVQAETKRIRNAFERGEQSVPAYNVYGVGYSTYGIGYHTTANHGIGNTYAEVSIKDQRIWIYQNGKLKVTTNVVTGRHNTHEDTPKGLWYIMYKQSPSTLVGSEVGSPHYSVKVSYWAPFTLSGCGFHDAYWRKNWAPDAYINQGSGGCVNTPPKVMKQVYDTLTQNEPVVIY